jgi:hypothetical protein
MLSTGLLDLLRTAKSEPDLVELQNCTPGTSKQVGGAQVSV